MTTTAVSANSSQSATLPGALTNMNSVSGGAGNPPKLLSQLESGITVPEGEPVHLDVRVSSESDVKITWMKDGKPLISGSRLHDTFDRGYACMDLEYTYTQDTGMYSCVVENRSGSVSADPVQITVIPEEAEQYETVAMQNQAYDNMTRPNQVGGEPVFQGAQPVFKQPIQCVATAVAEGQPSRFFGEISPAGDSSLQVDWYRDGKPIVIGSRFSSMVDRGMVVLDISCCYPEDNGAYTCVAFNKAGRVESAPITLTCEAGVRIVTSSNLSANTMGALKHLDDPGAEYEDIHDRLPDPIAPSFKGPIVPPQLRTMETMDAYFEVPVDTGNGHKVDFVWLRDGDPVHFGSRLSGKLEMGMASLSFKYTLTGDNGKYVCVITTEHGKAQSDPAELTIEKTGNISTDTQFKAAKGLQAVQDLEAMLNAPRPDTWTEDGPAPAPSIVIQPKPIGECAEDSTVSFHLQYEPSNDPKLVAQWYKDGEPLTSGNRFRVECERGIASLVFMHTIHQDTGSYWCKISNASGSIDTDHLELKCVAGARVITQSNLLEGSEGLKLLQAIEQGHDGHEFGSRYSDDVQSLHKPEVDVPPKPCEAILGNPARFLVKMSGYPMPEITWSIDGAPVVQDSIFKVMSDGGFSVLELNKCSFDLGKHTISVRGESNQGSAEASTELTVHPADYKVPDLKHVTPDNPFRKQAQLKRVQCTPELSKAFSKAKASPAQLIDMDQGPEIRAKTFRSPETIAAEELLNKVTTGLRKSNIRVASEDNHVVE